MKNNGFIKETQKGSNVFKATSKLQVLTEKATGISYNTGCSSKHSAKIGRALGYLPKDIVSEGRFESGKMLQHELKMLKKLPEERDFEKAITSLQKNILQQEHQIQSAYNTYLSDSSLSKSMRFQAEIDYRADMQLYQMKKEVIFSDTPLFIPDFAVNASREEVSQILQNMNEQISQLQDGSKEQSFFKQNAEKLQQMLETEQQWYSIYFEIVTDSYGRQELERHHNYETVLQREVLYIY